MVKRLARPASCSIMRAGRAWAAPPHSSGRTSNAGVRMQPIRFETHPDRYRHWKLGFEGPVARLALDVQEDAPLRPGYVLKLNSYDLGVDLELADAVQRLRFEHPEVGAVVVTSA